jgi:DNA invertase Pin-like site-specific DNA recombinase
MLRQFDQCFVTRKPTAYVRVSTDRQAEQAVSLEAQEAKIRAMSTVRGADLAEVIVDGGKSAKSLNRPGLERRLARTNAGESNPSSSPSSTG